jgi:hypothetical protein
MDQGPNSGLDLASGRLDRVQFVLCLEFTGELVEARVAGHGYLVVLAGNPKSPICVWAWRWAEYEKIVQLAALFWPSPDMEKKSFIPSRDRAGTGCRRNRRASSRGVPDSGGGEGGMGSGKRSFWSRQRLLFRRPVTFD